MCKTEVVSIRIKPEEKELIKKAALKDNRAFGNYIVTNMVIKAKEDLQK